GSQHSGYRAQNEDGAKDNQPDPLATDESVADAQPVSKRPPFVVPHVLISLEELGIIKMTALFAVRVVMPSNNACTAAVLDDFFHFLPLEKLERRVAVLDLHAFVSGVDCFASLEGVDYCTLMENVDYSSIMPLPPTSVVHYFYDLVFKLPLRSQMVRLQLLRKVLAHTYDQFESLAMGMLVPSPPLPLPEEPEAERQKRESALAQNVVTFASVVFKDKIKAEGGSKFQKPNPSNEELDKPGCL
ncbi:hypothetical protein AALP_AAs53210U000300, partial [Arabis alpina]